MKTVALGRVAFLIIAIGCNSSVERNFVDCPKVCPAEQKALRYSTLGGDKCECFVPCSSDRDCPADTVCFGRGGPPAESSGDHGPFGGCIVGTRGAAGRDEIMRRDMIEQERLRRRNEQH